MRTTAGDEVVVVAADPVRQRHFLAFRLRYQDGDWVELTYTLFNDSPFDVTIQAIPAFTGDPFRRAQVSIASANGTEEGLKPFAGPVVLPSRGARMVRLRWTWGGCPFAGKRGWGGIEMYQQRVTFRFLGVSRTEFVPFPFFIGASGSGGCRGVEPAG